MERDQRERLRSETEIYSDHYLIRVSVSVLVVVIMAGLVERARGGVGAACALPRPEAASADLLHTPGEGPESASTTPVSHNPHWHIVRRIATHAHKHPLANKI